MTEGRRLGSTDGQTDGHCTDRRTVDWPSSGLVPEWRLVWRRVASKACAELISSQRNARPWPGQAKPGQASLTQTQRRAPASPGKPHPQPFLAPLNEGLEPGSAWIDLERPTTGWPRTPWNWRRGSLERPATMKSSLERARVAALERLGTTTLEPAVSGSLERQRDGWTTGRGCPVAGPLST